MGNENEEIIKPLFKLVAVILGAMMLLSAGTCAGIQWVRTHCDQPCEFPAPP